MWWFNFFGVFNHVNGTMKTTNYRIDIAYFWTQKRESASERANLYTCLFFISFHYSRLRWNLNTWKQLHEKDIMSKYFITQCLAPYLRSYSIYLCQGFSGLASTCYIHEWSICMWCISLHPFCRQRYWTSRFGVVQSMWSCRKTMSSPRGWVWTWTSSLVQAEGHGLLGHRSWICSERWQECHIQFGWRLQL